MKEQLESVKVNLKKVEEMLVPRLKSRPKNPPYVYSKMQIDYIKELIEKSGTITTEDEKNIDIGIMSVKENLDAEDPELDEQISKLTWAIGKLTGRIKGKE